MNERSSGQQKGRQGGTPGGRSGVRAAKAAETKAALKEAARGEFVTRGYQNTKITDITAAAGRSTGSFYDHFADKEELLRELLDDVHEQGHAHFAGEKHPRDHDLTDRAQLHEHLAVAWRVMADNLGVTTALYEANVTAGPASGRAWQRLTEDTAMLRAHLEYLRGQGRPLPGDPELVAAAIGALLGSLAYALLPQPAPAYDGDEVVGTVTSLLLDGLRGPGPGREPGPE